MKARKIYSKSTLTNGLHWWLDIGNQHITMRLAWKPSFLLEQYRLKYWEEWDKKYLELLEMLHSVEEDGKSPFVFYVRDRLKKE